MYNLSLNMFRTNPLICCTAAKCICLNIQSCIQIRCVVHIHLLKYQGINDIAFLFNVVIFKADKQHFYDQFLRLSVFFELPVRMNMFTMRKCSFSARRGLQEGKSVNFKEALSGESFTSLLYISYQYGTINQIQNVSYMCM